jgi:hypothetical protein
LQTQENSTQSQQQLNPERRVEAHSTDGVCGTTPARTIMMHHADLPPESPDYIIYPNQLKIISKIAISLCLWKLNNDR